MTLTEKFITDCKAIRAVSLPRIHQCFRRKNLFLEEQLSLSYSPIL